MMVRNSKNVNGIEYTDVIMRGDSYKDNERLTPILSLCMPTNGVLEWAFPSLDSIYNQGVDESLFEVIVMDNGNNDDFKKQILNYQNKYKNLKYYHTDKPLFLSEPEAYKMASGELIKFINHRNVMVEGSIDYLLRVAEQYRIERPVIYCSNGVTRQRNTIQIYDSFSKFVKGLEHFSTWSSGMTIWHADIDTMPEDEKYNFLFPHTNFLFHKRDSKSYIIDGTKLWIEIKQGKKPKGNYNVFYAFAVEFPSILLDLLRDGDLRYEDFISVKRDILDFLSELYFKYIIKKEYCSYDLEDYKNSISVFFSESAVRINIIFKYARLIKRKILGIFVRG